MNAQVVLTGHPKHLEEFALWLRHKSLTPDARTTKFADQIEQQGYGRTKVVIDYEDREQVERLARVVVEAAFKHGNLPVAHNGIHGETIAVALREFANPKTTEPTDPAARVTDRRENIWRLLADGDWVCTSGPDIGEYLNWDQLAGDRGPVTVEVQS